MKLFARCFVLFIAATATNAAAELIIEVAPESPIVTTPVVLTVSDEFPQDCYFVCDVAGQWIQPDHYHIDWQIQFDDNPKVFCNDVVTPRSSEIVLGTLDPRNYEITVDLFVTGLSESCGGGGVVDTAQVMFEVCPRSGSRRFRMGPGHLRAGRARRGHAAALAATWRVPLTGLIRFPSQPGFGLSWFHSA